MTKIQGLILTVWQGFTPNYYLRLVPDSLCLESGDFNICAKCMMMSSNENIFRVTGSLRGEVIGHRWIPFTKASDAEH